MIGRTRRLLVRVDAGEHGWGHAMRCLAVAQAWRELGGEVEIWMSADDPRFAAWATAAGWQIQWLGPAAGVGDQRQLWGERLREWQPAWVLLDGYHFTKVDCDWVTAAAIPLAVFDDEGSEQRKAHDRLNAAAGIINGSCSAQEAHYSAFAPRAWLLIGPRFFPLRSEFWPRDSMPRLDAHSPSTTSHSTTFEAAAAGNLSKIPVGTETADTKVVVTLGARPPEAWVAAVYRELVRARTLTQGGSDNWRVTIFAPMPSDLASKAPEPSLMGMTSEREGVMRAESNASVEGLQVTWDCAPEKLVKEIPGATVAITAGGTTVYELARQGVPMIAVPLAENQRPSCRALATLGAIKLAEGELPTTLRFAETLRELLETAESRQKLRIAASGLVDGQGARRIARKLWHEPIRFRRAVAADSRRWWELRNSIAVRRVSCSFDPIEFSEHERWFAGRWRLPDPGMWVWENGWGEFLGQVRIDVNVSEKSWAISLALSEMAQGLGIASRQLPEVMQAFSQRHPDWVGFEWQAWVREDNHASLKLFKRLGFQSRESKLFPNGRFNRLTRS